DEDFGPCVPTATTGCRVGRSRCQGGRMVCVARTPSTEVCSNGIDEDCNGVVDDSALCSVNLPMSATVRIGNDDTSVGEGDDTPAHPVCLAQFSLDLYEVSNDAFVNWLNTLDSTRFKIDRPPTPLNPSFVYGTYLLYNDGTPQAPVWTPLVQMPLPTD